MAYQGIGTGTTPNDNSGDSLLTGAIKINSNFTEIYDALGDGSTLSLNTKVGFSTVRTIPPNTGYSPSLGSPSFNNSLFILEGPTSVLTLNSSFPLGTRVSIISKNSANVINKLSGTLIMGLDENLNLDSDYASFDIVWTGPDFGWAIK
jgi:hypothetical protein